MIFIVTGGLGLCALLVAAAWMGTLARQNPARRFRISGRGVRTAEVTFRIWIRRYFPWSAALSLLLIGVGVLVRKR